MASDLAGKGVLITGGGSGMGWAIAKALAEQGCRVAISGRNEQKLRDAAATFKGSPPILFRACDVANRPAVKELVGWAMRELGRIDILINSAGVNIKNRTMEAMRPEQWDEVLAANATGAYNVMYEVLPQMRARRDGLIINISSTSGKRAGKLGGVAYNASKFALTALSTSVAQEEAPNGIRVTSVFPGEVNTPILEQRPNPVSDEHKAAILQPDDVAAIVVPLCLLAPHVHVPELVIKPLRQEYV
jgi:NAD(P)-dependent dehydrogenase (short-subunit alcohol dehydrogenase family)